MFCVKCGLETPDQDEFCSNCGTPIRKADLGYEEQFDFENLEVLHAATLGDGAQESHANDIYPAEVVASAKPASIRNTNFVLIAAISVAVIFAVALAIFMASSFGANGPSGDSTPEKLAITGEEAKPETSNDSSSLQESSLLSSYTLSAIPKVELDWGYFQPTEQLISLKFKREEGDRFAILNSADDRYLAQVFPENSASRYENEIVMTRVKIGALKKNRGQQSVYLFFVMASPDGNSIYAGQEEPIDYDSLKTLIEHDLGITPEDFAKQFYIYDDAGGLEQCKIVDAHKDESPNIPEDEISYSVRMRLQPFYGVWIGASKDINEATEIAKKAGASPADCVTNTQEWAGLNSEPWYVVTYGRYYTEQEAQQGLAKAKAAGYTDAYIKYSGNHI